MTVEALTSAALALPPQSRAALANELWRSLEPHRAGSSGEPGRGDDIRRRFQEYREEWKRQSRLLSISAKMAMLPPYQQIIGLGPAAIPLILEELQRAPDHWFWALEALTGADPVPADARGNLVAMAEAWVAWGQRHGYLPE
jgi:hypothetical protein